jgi:hypothetical protein
VLPADTCQTSAGIYRPLVERQYAQGLKAAAGNAAAAQTQVDLGAQIARMEASCSAEATGKHLVHGGAAEGEPPLAGDCAARPKCQWVSQYDVRYPDTLINFHSNETFIKACDVPALPRDDAYWSHSNRPSSRSRPRGTVLGAQ